MILAFVSRKGGVGKTTSAVNLGGALVRLGARVLIVDLDAQASASRFLGVERSALAPSIHDVLFRGLPLPEVVRPTGVPGLELVTASVDLMHADLDLQNLRRREEVVQLAIADHAVDWDWILLDCPPAINSLTRNALVAADAYVSPTSPHFLAFEGVEVLLDSAARLLARHGRGDTLAGILLTMVDYRTTAAREHGAAIRRRFGLRVFDTEIPINVRLAESAAQGRTIFETEPRAAGAHAYRMLAVELLDRLEAPLPAATATARAAADAARSPAESAEPPAEPAPNTESGPASEPPAPSTADLERLPTPPGRPN